MTSNPISLVNYSCPVRDCSKSNLQPVSRKINAQAELAAAITKAASRQTYYTIRWLVDRRYTADAYYAYAYFRWLDDKLDQNLSGRGERMAFVDRQRRLIETAYQGASSPDLTPEERLVIDLIRSDLKPNSGLQTYIQNMLAVMAFDADRRGRLISQQELDTYTRHLAVAVTEALHYYIGHDQFAPRDDSRYLAVAAAHITHMLRDTFEDVAAGYYNIPREYLEAHGINPWEVESRAYQDWVKHRVELARDYFRSGKAYLARVENNRCRLAGYAYTARFEGVLDAIEHEDYQLRPDYEGERKSVRGALKMGWSVLTLALKSSGESKLPSPDLERSTED